ncbi:MAG TPA: radical SAM protein, partial [Geothrix sp.]
MVDQRDPVLFVLPPGGAGKGFREHLGAAFLRAVLLRAGISSRQYLPNRMPSLTDFEAYLRERSPAIVGFTVYETNLHLSRALAEVVHKALPETVVLVGGPTATFTPEEALDLVGADGCLRGAGEAVMVAIAERILGAARPRRDLSGILNDLPNLVLRTPEAPISTRSTILSSFPYGGFETLDDIPSPFQAGLVSSAEIGYVTARGCNQQCTYCSFAAVSAHQIRFHGVERVLDDLAALEQLGSGGMPQKVEILDDAFTLVPDRARRICEGILDRGLHLDLSCSTRGDRVDRALLQTMRRAGFTSVAFGLESAVPRILRTIGKVSSPETSGDPGFDTEKEFLTTMRASVAEAREAGLRVYVSVMGGLPTETAHDFRTTLAFVDSLGVNGYAHNLLTRFPGTPLYAQRERFG